MPLTIPTLSIAQPENLWLAGQEQPIAPAGESPYLTTDQLDPRPWRMAMRYRRDAIRACALSDDQSFSDALRTFDAALVSHDKALEGPNSRTFDKGIALFMGDMLGQLGATITQTLSARSLGTDTVHAAGSSRTIVDLTELVWSTQEHPRKNYLPHGFLRAANMINIGPGSKDVIKAIADDVPNRIPLPSTRRRLHAKTLETRDGTSMSPEQAAAARRFLETGSC